MPQIITQGTTFFRGSQPASGGGSGNTEFLTGQTINNGSTDLAHTLGAAPTTVLFFRSTGEPLMLQWQPKPGSETTTITVTNSMPAFAGVTVQLSKP